MKLRGQRIELGEIEHALTSQPAVVDAVVLLRSDLGEPTLVAYVHPASVLGALPGELNALPLERVQALVGLRDALPSYMLPSIVVKINDWPRTSSNKIDRQGLPKPIWRASTLHSEPRPENNVVPERTVLPDGHISLDDGHIRDLVIKHLCTTLHFDDSSRLDQNAPLMDMGLNSLQAVLLMRMISEGVGTALPATMCFAFPTIRKLTAAIYQQLDLKVGTPRRNAHAAQPPATFCPKIIISFGSAHALLPSAVGSRSLSSLSLCGSNVLTEVPASRWARGMQLKDDPIACRARHGAFICNTDFFDCTAFGLSPAETHTMDPHQRALLEGSYSATNAIRCSFTLWDGIAAGVFVAIAAPEYGRMLASSPQGFRVYAATGASLAVASGRVSYTLGLMGPCASYDTACSAGLTAFHAARCALQLKECQFGLVAAVNLMLTPYPSKLLAVVGMTSAHGRSQTFDHCADGYARGEACGTITLHSDHPSDAQVLGSAVCPMFRGGQFQAAPGIMT